MDNSKILYKLSKLSEYLIMKGGKKNTSKLIKVKRPFKTKSGKIGYRDTWVLPGQVKSDEKIHNEHKLHHLLPKEHPDYKKKELHPNFVAGRDKHLEARKKLKAEAPSNSWNSEMVKAHEKVAKKLMKEMEQKEKKGGKKKDNEPSPNDLAKQQKMMRDAALRVMEADHNADNIKTLMAFSSEPSISIKEMKKRLKSHGVNLSHKEIHDAVQNHNKKSTKPHEKLGMSNMNKPLKDREIKMHPAHQDELLHKEGYQRGVM
jgi:hypothetical protein